MRSLIRSRTEKYQDVLRKGEQAQGKQQNNRESHRIANRNSKISLKHHIIKLQ